MATRWRCPPESSCGKRPPKPDRAHILQRLRHLARNLRCGRLCHLEREGDIALHRHVREKRVVLEDGTYRPFLWRALREVLAIEEDAAPVRQVEAADHAQQRGLAAAGGPEQREEFAGLDGEADTIDGHEIAKAARHILNLEVAPLARKICVLVAEL